MKRGKKQIVFLATVFTLTALTLFVLQFEMTGHSTAPIDCEDIANAFCSRAQYSPPTGTNHPEGTCSEGYYCVECLGDYVESRGYCAEKKPCGDILDAFCSKAQYSSPVGYNLPHGIGCPSNTPYCVKCLEGYTNNEGFCVKEKPCSTIEGAFCSIIEYEGVIGYTLYHGTECPQKTYCTKCKEGYVESNGFCVEGEITKNNCEQAGFTCGEPIQYDDPHSSCDALEGDWEWVGIQGWTGGNYFILDNSCGDPNIGASFCCRLLSDTSSGKCGKANDKIFDNVDEVIAAGLCEVGTPNPKTPNYDENDVVWYWNCIGKDEKKVYCHTGYETEPPDQETILVLSDEEFKEGYTEILKQGEKIKFSVEEKDGTDKYHYIEIINITKNTVKIKIESKTYKEIFKEGDIKKYDLTGDLYYDVKITVEEIKSDSVEITIKSIHEKFNTEDQSKQKDDESDAEETQNEDLGKEESNIWIYLLVSMVILIIFVVLIIYLASRRRVQ